MRHIPFVAFPPAEQEALLATLRQAGVAPQRICVSRVEWVGESAALTTVTAPGWSRTYGRDWLQALASDLRAGAHPGNAACGATRAG